MKPRYQVSRTAIELIERFEGYRSKAAQLPDGRWTLGYGHTLTARADAEVSKADAEALLIYDLIAIAHVINERVFTPLTQNQFDALCAFAFNIGVESFQRSSVLRRLNEGSLLQAACAMELWRKADFEGERIVIDALVRRRAAEKALFLTPPGGFVPAPTPVLRPNLDLDGTGLVPRETPTVLTTSLDGDATSVEREAIKPTSEADEAPSATQAAAAAVSARLATIFPDEDPVEVSQHVLEPEVVQPEPEPEEVEPEPELEVGEAVEPELPLRLVYPEPAPEPEPVEPDPEPVAPMVLSESISAPASGVELPIHHATFNDLDVEAEFEPLPVAEDHFPRVASLEPDAEDAEAEATPRFRYLPLVGLTALGGAIFGGGIFWAVSALGGPDGLWAFGWVAALVGIVLLGRAAYLFLEQLGRIGGGLDGDLDGN